MKGGGDELDRPPPVGGWFAGEGDHIIALLFKVLVPSWHEFGTPVRFRSNVKRQVALNGQRIHIFCGAFLNVMSSTVAHTFVVASGRSLTPKLAADCRK